MAAVSTAAALAALFLVCIVVQPVSAIQFKVDRGVRKVWRLRLRQRCVHKFFKFFKFFKLVFVVSGAGGWDERVGCWVF